MANETVHLKLTLPNNAHEESVLLRTNATWASPAGGWLDGVSGTWSKAVMPEQALLLKTSNGEVGRCFGLDFGSAAIGDNGRLHLEKIADAGQWKVWMVES